MIIMRKVLFLLFACLALTVQAQEQRDSITTLKIGYLSYEKALKALPDYALQQKKLADLRAQYEAELKRIETEFNQKYEEFLDGQKDFPRTILLKRQTELKEMMERNVAFRNDSRRELQQAETEAMQPLRCQLNELLAKLAKEQGFSLILNTDGDACPYIDGTVGEDIMPMVVERLRN